jgi:predicted Zn-dependent protease with MMP-like domain
MTRPSSGVSDRRVNRSRRHVVDRRCQWAGLVRAIACPEHRVSQASGQTGRVDTDEKNFERLVADALDQIPEALGRMMENVVVLVEDWPTADQLGGRRGTLLGLYQGIDLTRRSPLSYAGVMPDRITIFRGPISRLAASETELVNLVTTTVIHEVAHHFGISDARLEELGWA